MQPKPAPVQTVQNQAPANQPAKAPVKAAPVEMGTMGQPISPALAQARQKAIQDLGGVAPKPAAAPKAAAPAIAQNTAPAPKATYAQQLDPSKPANKVQQTAPATVQAEQKPKKYSPYTVTANKATAVPAAQTSPVKNRI